MKVDTINKGDMDKKDNKGNRDNTNHHHINNHHSKDKVFKESMELFKGNSLDFLGIETEGNIEEILSGEITETTTKKSYADYVFRVAEDKGIHTEWQTNVSGDDIMRFASYNIDLCRKHGIQFETVIITNNKPSAISYKNPSITFTPKVVNLKDRDADETIKQIEDKIDKGQNVNLLEVVYLPFYGSGSGKSLFDLFGHALELVPKVTESEQVRNKLNSLLLLVTSSFVNEEEFKRILEVNAMRLDDNIAVKVLSEKGEEKAKSETAKKMHQKGFSTTDIAEMVSMPISWVENVLNLEKA